MAASTTDTQQDFLNPIGVNVIRQFPASGIVIWGARTLATRSDPEYRYIPVRRTAVASAVGLMVTAFVFFKSPKPRPGTLPQPRLPPPTDVVGA